MAIKKRPFLVGAVLLLIVVVAGMVVSRYYSRRHPNVVLIVIDTLRADHLGVYGYTRDTSPNLDAFAKEYNRCAFAVATAPWTPASMVSILSGMFAQSHRYMPPNHAADARRANVTVPDSIQMLPEVLKGAGYATAAVSSNAWVTKELNFDQGFDRFVFRNGVTADILTQEAKQAVRNLENKPQPFFLYVHYLDPHDPYRPPRAHDIFKGKPLARSYPQDEVENIDKYDGEIHSVDYHVGALFTFLKSHKLFDDSIIFVVADHGEQFREHAFRYHGNQVYNTESHVPLLFKLGKDGPRGTVIEHTVSTIDIFSTILGTLGLDIPAQAGLSVLLTDEKGQAARAGVFSAMVGNLRQKSFTTYDGLKLIIGTNTVGEKTQIDDPSRNIIGLFDARKDHFEESPLTAPVELGKIQDDWQTLDDQALRLAVKVTTNKEEAPSEEILKQLKSLGYMK